MTAPHATTSPVEAVATAAMPDQYMDSMANGLTLVAERFPEGCGVRSAAMTLLVAAGAASDPVGQSGSAAVLSDWILRGAGSRDSRELTSYLDGLGVQRACTADSVFLRFSASLLGKNLLAVLPAYADIVRRPHLPDTGFEPARDLALQQLDAIEDEPSQKLSLILRERQLPYPFGRPSVGIHEELENLSAESLRSNARQRLSPRGAILAVAGCFDWDALRDAVEGAFGDWDLAEPTTPQERPAPRGNLHVMQDTNQMQIGLSWDAVPDAHRDSILVQAALNVLSGGMGARLFTEIREKQGLCYSVHAGYASLRTIGAVFGYAGTSPDRAQRTFDSFLAELRRLEHGVTAEELERARIGMKSRVIMQGESTAARANALASDFYHRRRTRTLLELRQLIEGVMLDDVNGYLAANPVRDLTVVTIGPQPLTVER